MERIRILLADRDEKYLMPLERKFINELDEQAELIVISDPDYMRRFFSTPQNLDLVLINKEMYGEDMDRHNIAHLFLLSEKEPGSADTGRLNTQVLYKYTSVKEIYTTVFNRTTLRQKLPLVGQHVTYVILIYSPVGGIGKTTAAMGLCAAFAQFHRRALFVGADNLQSHRYLVEQFAGDAPRNAAGGVEGPGVPVSCKGLFDLLPPYGQALPSLHLTPRCLIETIRKFARSGEYDYVVVDSASDFSQDTIKLMEAAGKVVLLAGQEAYATATLHCLLQNIDCSDGNKFLFVCSKYRQGPNALPDDPLVSRHGIQEYIPFDPAFEQMDPAALGSNGCFQKLALLFM